jgi:hypothetical protein
VSNAGYGFGLSTFVAGAGVLAASLRGDNLPAHLALARVGEQPPSSTPTSLPVRTTRGSDEPAAARAGRFWFDPAERDRSLGLDMWIASR